LLKKCKKTKLEIEENEKKYSEVNAMYQKLKEIAENYGIDENTLNKPKTDNNKKRRK